MLTCGDLRVLPDGVYSLKGKGCRDGVLTSCDLLAWWSALFALSKYAKSISTSVLLVGLMIWRPLFLHSSLFRIAQFRVPVLSRNSSALFLTVP